MSLLNNRQSSDRNEILEKRFIGVILREESAELNQKQLKLMSSRGFTNPAFFNNRGFNVMDDNKLEYTHPTVLRFIDMKTRATKDGQRSKKKSYAVHNKPIYGMVNNILRRLSFEYTDGMKKLLAKNHNIEL